MSRSRPPDAPASDSGTELAAGSVEPPTVTMDPGVDLAALFERAESLLLGGPRRYSRAEVAARSGVEPEQSRRLWRALGFASVADDDVVFTDGDVAALLQTKLLAEHGIDDPELLTAMTRMIGQTFSRLAAWQGQLLVELVSQRPELLHTADDMIKFVSELVPVLEEIQAFVWRRQLAAYFSRVASHSMDVSPSGVVPAVVGFADMQGFTTLTRRASEAELRELLEAFESTATDVVGAHDGRIVKALGDEILFVADTAAAGAEIALDLQESAADDPRLPQLRIGVAAGPVVARLGDVYGSTVNIASRLTGLCRPGWILVDRLMHEALLDDDRYALKARRPETVRGYHHLHQWRLRRAGEREERRR